jgi:uncharacterized protein DUF5317
MLASTIALGLIAGLIAGGQWDRLARLRIAWWPVLAIALGIRLAALFLGEVGLAVYLVSFGTIITGAYANRRLPGVPLFLVGASLNFLVVLLNGGMPIDPATAAYAGTYIPQDGLHITLSESTRLAAIADVVPVQWLQRVYSPGDVLLALGGFWLPFAALRTN